MIKKALAFILSVMLLLSATGCESDTSADTTKKEADLVTVYLLESHDWQQSSSFNRTTYYYNDDGHLIKEIDEPDDRDSVTYTYEYTMDGKGRITKKTYFANNMNNSVEYKYDSHNNLVEKISYVEDGQLDSTHTYYQYDEHDRLISQGSADEKGYDIEYTYDDLGHLIEKVYTEDGKIVMQYVYKNDAYGNPTEEMCYHADGTLYKYYCLSNKYTYNNQGLISKITVHHIYSGTADIDVFYRYKEIRIDRTLAKNLVQVYGNHLVIIDE